MSSDHAIQRREQTLQVAGLRLAAKVWGTQQRRKAIALHGWLDNAASFDGLAPLLPGVQLAALDLAGHGLSEHRPPSASYDFVHWIPDVIAAADALEWQRCALIGHSLGGAIAACAAAVEPERFDRLVLLDALGPQSDSLEAAPETLAAALSDRRRLAMQTRPRTYQDPSAATQMLLAANPALSAQAARVLVERGTRDHETGVAWRYDARLRCRSLLRLSEEQIQAFLRRIRCPVLLVRPNNGWPFDEAAWRARLACVPDIKVVQVDGSHHVHLVSPERVGPLIDDFLTTNG